MPVLPPTSWVTWDKLLHPLRVLFSSSVKWGSMFIFISNVPSGSDIQFGMNSLPNSVLGKNAPYPSHCTCDPPSDTPNKPLCRTFMPFLTHSHLLRPSSPAISSPSPCFVLFLNKFWNALFCYHLFVLPDQLRPPFCNTILHPDGTSFLLLPVSFIRV